MLSYLIITIPKSQVLLSVLQMRKLRHTALNNVHNKTAKLTFKACGMTPELYLRLEQRELAWVLVLVLQ